jgi:hypothetical protein
MATDKDVAHYRQPISLDLADAILCEVSFRQSHWYDWQLSPHEKRRDRQVKDAYERAERRRAFVLDTIASTPKRAGAPKRAHLRTMP